MAFFRICLLALLGTALILTKLRFVHGAVDLSERPDGKTIRGGLHGPWPRVITGLGNSAIDASIPGVHAGQIPLATISQTPAQGADHAIIYPRDPKSVEGIRAFLESRTFDESGQQKTWLSVAKQASAPRAQGFTAFFFVKNLPQSIIAELQTRPDVAECYGQYMWNAEHYPGRSRAAVVAQAMSTNGIDSYLDEEARNDTLRELEFFDDTDYWELSQISTPAGDDWLNEAHQEQGFYLYEADTSLGQGQTIYFVEDNIQEGHREFALSLGNVNRQRVRRLPAFDYGSREHEGPQLTDHGTQVLSKAWGARLGLARRAQAVVVENANGDPPDKNNFIHERYLESLVRVLNDVAAGYPANRGTVILNMSFGWMNIASSSGFMKPAHWDILYEVLKELDKLDVVMVAAAHNDYRLAEVRNRLDGWPSRFADPATPADQAIRNLIVVGGTNINTQVGPHSPTADWLAMAPGWLTYVAVLGGDIQEEVGNSLATPMVAALIAYWRGLPITNARWKNDLKDPSNVKKLLFHMQRKLEFTDQAVDTGDVPPKEKVPLIWTGEVADGNCLVKPALRGCPVLPPTIASLQPAPLRESVSGEL